MENIKFGSYKPFDLNALKKIKTNSWEKCSTELLMLYLELNNHAVF